MSCKSISLRRHVGLAGVSVAPLCLILSACGGGGGGNSHVANIPPPPTPSPAPTFDVQKSLLASPATRAGTYDVIGRLSLAPAAGPSSSRLAAPGEFTMSSSRRFSDDPFQYVLTAPGHQFGNVTSITVNQPFLSWSFSASPSRSRSFANQPLGNYCCQFLGEHLTAFSKGAGGNETQILSYDLTRASTNQQPSGTNNNLLVSLDYDVGYSYVAMGDWSWRVILPGGGFGDLGELLFVNGDRTPASGIPASGTATYDARTFALLSSNGTAGIPFSLTANFGQRTMSAQIAQDYQYNSAGASADPILGIHVAGSAPFGNDGLFDIPLAGTMNYASTNLQAAPAAESVTGDMNGAFFGPHAEQVGGVLALDRAGGTVLVQDVFVGRQRR